MVTTIKSGTRISQDQGSQLCHFDDSWQRFAMKSAYRTGTLNLVQVPSRSASRIGENVKFVTLSSILRDRKYGQFFRPLSLTLSRTNDATNLSSKLNEFESLLIEVEEKRKIVRVQNQLKSVNIVNRLGEQMLCRGGTQKWKKS